ncbi:MAG: MraY family glycosyltransferase [Dokdonella sp.]|uniref:MraY family glycosyltransferase n=1 Tax=Dokdonella sp. TaxID=2291710 RepID=UPI003F7CFDB7
MAGAADPFTREAAIILATAALSAVATAAAIRYAHRRRLFDLPGQRRAHREPTPRGGGIAIVIAMLAGGGALVSGSASAALLQLLAPPIVGVALVGWLDDHGGLSAIARFAMHCAAAIWVLVLPWAGALGVAQAPPSGMLYAVVAIPVTVAIAWSINLHNFMDGINGLLTLQAIFVFGALATLAGLRDTGGAALCLVGAAACAGFLPFNFPRARIFMGDVGSGTLGFAIAMAVLHQVGSGRTALASGLVLCSAFATDATCTLLSRMLGGRRWYSAHREHLYQWLVRGGLSHARVVALYMGWNLLVALPVVGWMNFASPDPMTLGIAPALAVYILAAIAWWSGKRWCLRRARHRSVHAAA